MRGTFIAVVGPSGAGKDTLIRAALADRRDIVVARRIIAPPRDMIGEEAEMVSEAEFQTRHESGEFVLSWHAHGYRYAISRSVKDVLASGTHVCANLSRSRLACAERAFSPFKAIYITAQPAVLADRLAGRGRESDDAIERRLDRPRPVFPEGLPLVEIDNSDDLKRSTTAFIGALPPVIQARTA